MENKNSTHNITPPRESEDAHKRLERYRTPENKKRAAEIYRIMITNGHNTELFDIADDEGAAASGVGNGDDPEKAVEFLWSNPDARQKLFAYLRNEVPMTIINHGSEIGERVMESFNGNNCTQKKDAVTGETMDSLDYVALLAMRQLDGSFNAKGDTYVGEKGKDDGQHRQAAEFLLKDLGYCPPEPPNPAQLAEMKNEMRQDEMKEFYQGQIQMIENHVASIERKIQEIASNPDDFRTNYEQELRVIETEISETLRSEIDKLDQEFDQLIKAEKKNERDQEYLDRRSTRASERFHDNAVMIEKLRDQLGYLFGELQRLNNLVWNTGRMLHDRHTAKAPENPNQSSGDSHKQVKSTSLADAFK